MKFKLRIRSLKKSNQPARAPGRPVIDRDLQRSNTDIIKTTNLNKNHLSLMRKTGWKDKVYTQSYNDIDEFFKKTERWFSWSLAKSLNKRRA